MKRGVHICSFSSTDHLVGRKRTYKTIRAAVLEAGRFSVFEATMTPKDARIFTRLCKDPTLEIANVGYPWTSVKRKA